MTLYRLAEGILDNVMRVYLSLQAHILALMMTKVTLELTRLNRKG